MTRYLISQTINSNWLLSLNWSLEVEQERLQKEIAQQQVEQLKARLRSLGINPDNLV